MTLDQYIEGTPVKTVQLAREINVSQSTVWRWRLLGWQGVFLDCIRFGKDWYTTREAFADFVAQTNWVYAPNRPNKNRVLPAQQGLLPSLRSQECSLTTVSVVGAKSIMGRSQDGKPGFSVTEVCPNCGCNEMPESDPWSNTSCPECGHVESGICLPCLS